MKYLNILLDNERNDDQYREECIEAFDKYQNEYRKTRLKLPKNFVRIYEGNHRFHDAKIPVFSVLTEYSGFNRSSRKSRPSKVRFIIVDYDNSELVWEVMIDNILDIEIYCCLTEAPIFLEHFINDELLIEQNGYLSWDIFFSSGVEIKLVFKSLKIKELGKDEISKFRYETT